MALVTVANAHLQKSNPPRFQQGMDGGGDQHAITDIIDREIGDIFIVIPAVVNDDYLDDYSGC